MFQVQGPGGRFPALQAGGGGGEGEEGVWRGAAAPHTVAQGRRGAHRARGARQPQHPARLPQ